VVNGGVCTYLYTYVGKKLQVPENWMEQKRNVLDISSIFFAVRWYDTREY
jgi:hypothetical protein